MIPLLLACSPQVPLSEIEVASADLDGISATTIALVGGFTGGSATLSVVDTEGRHHSFPVDIKAGSAGALVEIDHTFDFGNSSALELPEEPLTADQLLGSYRGTEAALVVGAGVKGMSLENRHGVVLDKEFFAVGLSIYAGFEWAALSLGDNYGETYTWEEFVADSGFEAWDSDELDSSDTGWEPTDSGEPQDPLDDTGGPPSVDPGDSDGGVDCEGCAGDYCGCSTGPAGGAFMLLFPVILALLRRGGSDPEPKGGN